MILGIDHIALSGSNLDADCRELQAAGFSAVFREDEVPNDAAKKHFLKEYHPSHGIAYFRGAVGPSIELTVHGKPAPDAQALYEPVMTGRTWQARVDQKKSQGSLQAAMGREGAPALWRPFAAPVWITDDVKTGISAVVLRVPSCGVARDFWSSALRFRCEAEGQDQAGKRWSRLSFVSPVPQWCLTVVCWAAALERHSARLDAPGFNCVAFLSNNIEEDAIRLTSSGAVKSSGIFSTHVNGSNLRVCVAEGPQGELVELIQVPQSKGRS